MPPLTRRDFLRAALAATVLPAAGCGGGARMGDGRGGGADEVPRRALGRTGETVSIVGLGGFHLAVPASEQESLRILRTAVDGGITFLDNCWDYHDGESERRMGKALRDGYRDRVFLMTKVDGRTKASATQQLEESLRRLETDHVDLLQLHEVIRDDDPGRTFAPGGAAEALLEARRAGKARFLGFTGHKSPDIHLAMLAAAGAHGFRFDTVQMPLNVLDAHFRSFEHRVLPALLEQGIAPLGMKPMADARIVQRNIASAEECLRYAMSLPVATVITGCDALERVEQALRVARGFRPLAEADVSALLARTAPAAASGADERYKTTDGYDATTHNPSWLG
ncbi:aldo/keto reductase [Anaeromyxobacter dehalogenans 2CP-1]|uniref:Aldo/keto reductase n=1 Tax=Anaeromyxobacter dehalogenans (strain ATCC BAA-258 / DSM 21875 / 2CP-1) TaxID=455488 RepID=B8J732_ANAD2|nr:aldo/keto reductase [Anaeromyxobacter dehalogenans]ACL65222.1 aldo/keto reductase [Anaeromyxobacter dehalogenans 2CP-1]